MGLADFDPELRYRVARDVLEQAFGKPRQQVELEGEVKMPGVLYLPSWVSDDTEVLEGELAPDELEAGEGE